MFPYLLKRQEYTQYESVDFKYSDKATHKVYLYGDKPLLNFCQLSLLAVSHSSLSDLKNIALRYEDKLSEKTSIILQRILDQMNGPKPKQNPASQMGSMMNSVFQSIFSGGSTATHSNGLPDVD